MLILASKVDKLMSLESYSSKLLHNAVEQFATLPGIGRKTALRLTLYLLKQDLPAVSEFSKAILKLRKEINYCDTCYNISDFQTCEICANKNRDGGQVCVVENLQDVIAIENTHQFSGLYHVLGGVISPMDGIGPDELRIQELIERVKSGEINEIIMALSSTMEGDTTNYYLFKQLKGLDLKVTTVARGMAIGDEIEYTDEITLGKSILNRIPYADTLNG